MNEIVSALMAQSEILPWTSYRVLLQVKDESFLIHFSSESSKWCKQTSNAAFGRLHRMMVNNS